jgi:5-methylcytosine-specific restriction endonuclease McrA
MKVTKVRCDECNKLFDKPTNYVKRSKRHFCSKACFNATLVGNKFFNTTVPRKVKTDYPLSDKWPIEIQKRVHNRKKIWCIDYKGGKCEVCGYSKHPSALEFHHKNPVEKKFEIGDSKNSVSKKVLQKELDKCALLCANCHREVHAGLVVLEGD